MVNIYVVSDTHFGHENIIRYCDRPFSNAAEMDEVMIARWNAAVRPQDHVYHLGDVALTRADLHRVLPRLHGHKRLLLGNHDDRAPMADFAQYFEKILLWRQFFPLVLTHLPLHLGSFGKAQVNVHGHIHQQPSPEGPYLNACVERRAYTPVHLDVLLDEARPFLQR